MTNKAPAFQFYAADFLTDTDEWSIQEVGIYIRLLSSQWINGSLPDDLERLARIARCELSEIKESWPLIKNKFIENGDGRIINNKLETVREAQRKYRETKSKAGKLGAKAKWQKNDRVAGKRITKGWPSSSSSSSTSSLSSTSSSKNNMFVINHDLKTELPDCFNNDIFKQCLKDFSKQRTRIRAPLTDRALNLLIGRLLTLSNKQSDLAVAIMDQSIMNSWKGVFPLKEDNSSFDTNIKRTIEKYGSKD